MLLVVLCACLFLAVSVHSCCWYGDSYYNSRYGAHGIAYTSDDRSNGLWSDDSSLQGPYQFSTSFYIGTSCTGCTCTGDAVKSCTGSTVVLKGMNFKTIAAQTFSNSTTSISIINCRNFETFEEGTFEHLNQLQEILVQSTSLKRMPDLSKTIVRKVNLVDNKIVMDTNTHRGWRWPKTLEYLAMMENDLYWIPDIFVDGPNLRIA